MNAINCKNTLSPDEMRNTVGFWAKNTTEHIGSLLRLKDGTTATLFPCFYTELNELLRSFQKISETYNSGRRNHLPVRPELFFRENRRLINLLERMKFEGFGGYPYLQQTIFHYIYEQRYANAVFGILSLSPRLITVRFSGIPGQPLPCICSQMYFWSIIGAMHPSLLFGNEKFYRAASGQTRERMTDFTNRFNLICYELSADSKLSETEKLKDIFSRFSRLNSEFLSFLKAVKAGAAGIYTPGAETQMPKTLFGSLDHMIAEHTLVNTLNQSIAETLKS